MEDRPCNKVEHGGGRPRVMFAIVFAETGEAGEVPELRRNVMRDGDGADGERDLARREEGYCGYWSVCGIKMSCSNFVASHVELGCPR
jgi:hypothetical protein